MKYQIDQSGKIEQTEKPTVLAYTNDRSRSLLIPAKTKRQLQETFRRCGMTKVFVYHIFAAGIFCLISNLKQKTEIVIDKEYPGKEKLLSELIKKQLSVHGKPIHNISFKRIGNQPKVHYAAHDVYVKKKKPDIIISLTKIIRVLKKTDGRLRECLSTLVSARPRSIKKRYHKANTKSRKTVLV